MNRFKELKVKLTEVPMTKKERFTKFLNMELWKDNEKRWPLWVHFVLAGICSFILFLLLCLFL